MNATAPPPAAKAPAKATPPGRRERVSFRRLLWVGPLTVAVDLGVNYGIKLIVQALNPALGNNGRLQQPMIALTVEGAVAAVVVFALMAAFVPRPISWYRGLGVVALVLSLAPDIAILLGGAPAQTALRIMGPLFSVGAPPPPPRPAGAPSGPPAGFVLPPAPLEQVLVLMLLHVVTALVCIGLLTTLTRKRADEAETAPGQAALEASATS